jgi:hypothetical protein
MYSTGYFCQILMKIEFSQKIFEKYTNSKFHENPSSGSRVVPCIQTDGRTDMTKMIFASRNFATSPYEIHKNLSSPNLNSLHTH